MKVRSVSSPGRSIAGGLLLAVCLLGACSTAPGVAVRAPYGGSTPKFDNGPADEVKIGAVSGLGEVLVDGRGVTVYLFAADHQGAPSTCVSLCAVQWPPLVLQPGTGAPIAGPGIKPALLGTSARADGSTQITYNGWPLYTWPQDTAPARPPARPLPISAGVGTSSMLPDPPFVPDSGSACESGPRRA